MNPTYVHLLAFEPPHDITNKMTRALSEDSDQFSLCTQKEVKDPVFLHADSEDSDQPGHSDWANAQADLSLR